MPGEPLASGTKVCLLIARSVVDKLHLLWSFVYSLDCSILCFTETWLSDRILPSGFSVFRKDRPLRQGGGILIAIRDCISASSFMSPQNLEVVCVVI